MLITMDKLFSRCSSFNELFFTRHDFSAIKASLADGSLEQTSDDCSPTEQQLFICESAKRTKQYLSERDNRNIIVLASDKGGKVVIMDREDYIRKADTNISENVAAGNYSDVLQQVNPFLILDGTIRVPLLSKSYLLPLFYGCPKVHKPGMPLRPIIASRNMIGDFLSSWLLQKLNLVADSLSKYNVHGASEIVRDLKRFQLEDQHVLLTFDYVSMFTNIDVAATMDIIEENYHYISPTTSVPVSLFLECLRFFTTGFNGLLYFQSMGLAMGNRLAQILAEIRTNHALLGALERFDPSVVSFLYKYVDDVFSFAQSDAEGLLTSAIETAVGMKVTVTSENGNNEVEFLDCIFRRNDDGSVSTRWFKKDCSCLAVLNFHSFHPWRNCNV